MKFFLEISTSLIISWHIWTRWVVCQTSFDSVNLLCRPNWQLKWVFIWRIFNFLRPISDSHKSEVLSWKLKNVPIVDDDMCLKLDSLNPVLELGKVTIVGCDIFGLSVWLVPHGCWTNGYWWHHQYRCILCLLHRSNRPPDQPCDWIVYQVSEIDL